ncbi:hypothetical protein Hypma_005685 [Hypsizygus marmoreus]|uniref:Uncharacterized protein n=1 Tax=Hypsizygus marmoreus TaxID=39966 RepID=A0A369JXQ0_HYPMA|nr:hypothetical protein Hypma_005685 [Hypsizygus marmoreus]
MVHNYWNWGRSVGFADPHFNTQPLWTMQDVASEHPPPPSHHTEKKNKRTEQKRSDAAGRLMRHTDS